MAHSFRCSTHTDPDRIRDRRLAEKINVMESRKNILLFLPLEKPMAMIPELKDIDILHYCTVGVAVAYVVFRLLYTVLG